MAVVWQPQASRSTVTDLGRLSRTYRQGSGLALRGLMFGGVAFILLCTLLSETRLASAALFLVFFIVCSHAVGETALDANASVAVHEGGIVFRGRGRDVRLAWGDITVARERWTPDISDGPPRPTVDYILHTRTGESVQLPETLADFDELWRTIQRNVAARPRGAAR